MSVKEVDYDIAIVGGGPAGSPGPHHAAHGHVRRWAHADQVPDSPPVQEASRWKEAHWLLQGSPEAGHCEAQG